jgi:hypothetical protein
MALPLDGPCCVCETSGIKIGALASVNINRDVCGRGLRTRREECLDAVFVRSRSVDVEQSEACRSAWW